MAKSTSSSGPSQPPALTAQEANQLRAEIEVLSEGLRARLTDALATAEQIRHRVDQLPDKDQAEVRKDQLKALQDLVTNLFSQVK